MKKNYLKLLVLFTFIFTINVVNSQTQYATEVVIANGEAYGTQSSNIGIYNIFSSTYDVIDSMKTNSVQDVFVDENNAFVSAQTKIFSYDLDSKTKIAEAYYPGVSPSKGSIFTDDNFVFVGNWYGQSDSNIYAFDKNTLAFQYSVTEATVECGGGISLNDTLYIGQKIKGTIDGCAPWGCFSDSLGSIIVANANTGAYYRTIELGEAGNGISQIYNDGNYLFAVCAGSNKIVKIEIGTDIIEEIVMPTFTQSLDLLGTKLYLDLNSNVGYFDLSDGSFSVTSTSLVGTAIAYAPNLQKTFTTETDFSSYGNLNVTTDLIDLSVPIGVSSEAIALRFTPNTVPVAEDDSYDFVYSNTISEYLLSVIDNDFDADNDDLTITAVSTSNISGATVQIDGQNIKYTRAAGIASTDYFTYTVCDNITCDDAIVHITLKSLVGVNDIDENFINIYPIPASNFITIDADNIFINKIEIFNSLGKIVKISKKLTIDLENINKGIYFVTVFTDNRIYSKKITVIK